MTSTSAQKEGVHKCLKLADKQRGGVGLNTCLDPEDVISGGPLRTFVSSRERAMDRSIDGGIFLSPPSSLSSASELAPKSEHIT